MIKFPGYLTKQQARQSNQIILVVLLFVILIPFYINQSLSAENDNLFISRTGGRTTATIIIRKSPIKVWEFLTNYEEIGKKMHDIKLIRNDPENFKKGFELRNTDINLQNLLILDLVLNMGISLKK